MSFQGMREPLQNIDIVIEAANIMVHDQGLHFRATQRMSYIKRQS